MNTSSQGDSGPSMVEVLKPLQALRKGATGLETHKWKSGDVVIVTYPKSGTTLLQNMIFSMVVEAGGGPEGDPKGTKFTDIGEVVPFIEVAPLTNVWECATTPRLFKSHAGAEYFNVDNKDIKYIVCYRDGRNIPGSYLDFIVEWVNPGIVLSDADRKRIYHEYVNERFLVPRLPSTPSVIQRHGTWFTHVKDWACQKRDNVLVLNYEALIESLRDNAAAIATFLNLDVSEEALERVVAKCDRRQMARDARFRDSLISRAMGYAEDLGIKVREKGKGGFRDERFTVEEELMFKEMLYSTFSVNEYSDLVEKINSIQDGNDELEH